MNLKWLLLFLWLCCAGLPVAAQQPQPVTILGIDVEGNVYTNPQTILAISQLQPGQQISPNSDELRRAIANLWQRRQFEDIDIVVTRQTPAGVFLTIRVKEAPRLDSIHIEGNEEFSKEDLLTAIGKTRGDIIRSYDLYRIRKAILAKYKEEGMPFTRVQVERSEPDDSLFVVVSVKITEGIEFSVRSITIEGNRAFSDEELIDQFEETHSKEWWQFWRSDEFVQEEYEKDKELLLKFYQRHGFIDAQILRDTVVFDPDNEAVDITIWVDEGHQYYIRHIAFDGNLVWGDSTLLRRLDMHPGEVFDQEKFEKNLQADPEYSVASLYLDNGYLGVQLLPDVVKVGRDSVDITVKIREGKPFRIRRIDIVGNTKTYDKVIRRELFTRPGDVFNRSKLIQSIRALHRLNYFNPESLRPEIHPVDKTSVDITYVVEERSSDTFNAAIGLAPGIGITGSIGISLNNFSLKEPLKGGAGQIFNFTWEFGGTNSLRTFVLGFTEPWLFDEPTTVGFNLFDTRQRYGFDFRQTGVSINVGRRFRTPDPFFRGDWMVRFRRNESRGEFAGFRSGVTTEFTVRQTLSRISYDNPFFPTIGSRFAFTTQYAMGALGLGNTDYLKNELRLDMYTPVLRIKGQSRLVLYLGAQLGYITGLRTDTTIPPIEYYFMGGSGLTGFSITPLRGYDDRSIGPRDDVGRILGGQVLSKYVAELRFAVTLNPMPIYLLAFAEAGNVWRSLKETDPFDLKRAAGVGIRLLINPIGLMGFDWGYGFDPPSGTVGARSGWKFHFQFGR